MIGFNGLTQSGGVSIPQMPNVDRHVPDAGRRESAPESVVDMLNEPLQRLTGRYAENSLHILTTQEKKRFKKLSGPLGDLGLRIVVPSAGLGMLANFFATGVPIGFAITNPIGFAGVLAAVGLGAVAGAFWSKSTKNNAIQRIDEDAIAQANDNILRRRMELLTESQFKATQAETNLARGIENSLERISQKPLQGKIMTMDDINSLLEGIDTQPIDQLLRDIVPSTLTDRFMDILRRGGYGGDVRGVMFVLTGSFSVGGVAMNGSEIFNGFMRGQLDEQTVYNAISEDYTPSTGNTLRRPRRDALTLANLRDLKKVREDLLFMIENSSFNTTTSTNAVNLRNLAQRF